MADEFIDWSARPLEDLTRHIVETHHTYSRTAMDHIASLLAQELEEHAEVHGGLRLLRRAFDALRNELVDHFVKEEAYLFPYIIDMNDARVRGAPLPKPEFETVRSPIWLINTEHEGAFALLATIREASNGFVAPTDGCLGYQRLCAALEAFEGDFLLHTHLETKVLFPRAAALESAI